MTDEKREITKKTAERIFSPPFVLSFGNQCSVLFMERSQKLCATFWGFPVTNSSVLSLLKGKNISVPSAAVLLLDLRGHLILKSDKSVHLITI